RTQQGKQFYTVAFQPYELSRIEQWEYDLLTQQPGFNDFPRNFYVDMAPTNAGGQPQEFVWPPPSISTAVLVRYFQLMPDITTPESSTTIPWFPYQQYLVTRLAGEMMAVADDDRAASFLTDTESQNPQGAGVLLRRYLNLKDDPEGRAKVVSLDRRRFGISRWDRLPSTKTIGWPYAGQMSLRPAQPLPWSPGVASDAVDSTTAPSGVMAALSNLIPDPSTRDLWQCRPAAVLLNDLATTFNTPTFISVVIVLGNRMYGMVSTARNPGQDEPFCYNITTNTFVTISGVTGVNTSISPAQTGAWNPPTMALVGTKIIVSHPGFTGAGGAFFGVIDTTNPNALTWAGTNTTVNPLTTPPQWVQNFNGRCHFLVN